MFQLFKIGYFFFAAVPMRVVSVVMIAEGGINPHWCIEFTENIHVVIHFFGGIIDQVTGKQDEVRLFVHDHIYSVHHCFLISKASAMNVRDLNNLKSFKRDRHILERHRDPPYTLPAPPPKPTAATPHPP